jgi:hypothetical protein
MVGTAPAFMASRNDCVSAANIGPVRTMDPSCFGLALCRIYFAKASIPERNSGRISSICTKKERKEQNKTNKYKLHLFHNQKLKMGGRFPTTPQL